MRDNNRFRFGVTKPKKENSKFLIKRFFFVYYVNSEKEEKQNHFNIQYLYLTNRETITYNNKKKPNKENIEKKPLRFIII